MFTPSPGDLLRKAVPLPNVTIPPGRLVDLPGRGSLYVTDVAGPPGAPTIVLLHALACTGMLCWFPTVPELARSFRVVVPDLRWHGRGLTHGGFSLRQCADDVAALVETLELGPVILGGFSMGSFVAQRVWRQHPRLVSGLVLAGTTDRMASTLSERTFHTSMGIGMALLRGLNQSRVARRAGMTAAAAMDFEDTGIHRWALREFRSVSPWALGTVVAEVGRHHSAPWLPSIDVPTAVVITERDRVLPLERQYAVADAIPGATVHRVDAGHASVVLESERFVPVFVEACTTTADRTRKAA